MVYRKAKTPSSSRVITSFRELVETLNPKYYWKFKDQDDKKLHAKLLDNSIGFGECVPILNRSPIFEGISNMFKLIAPGFNFSRFTAWVGNNTVT